MGLTGFNRARRQAAAQEVEAKPKAKAPAKPKTNKDTTTTQTRQASPASGAPEAGEVDVNNPHQVEDKHAILPI